MNCSESIKNGNTYLGIEIGSTRIKACLTDSTLAPIASGSFSWENRLENGYWTYSLEEVRNGVRECYASLCRDVKEKYGVRITKVASIGISGMMHGYLVFDENWTLLTPFRTWRNTVTAEASRLLTETLSFHVPQRWSASHIAQAILNNEEHIGRIRYLTTVAGYVHHLLTGRHEVGICEASGMFPLKNGEYDPERLIKFDDLFADKKLPFTLSQILPKIRSASDCTAVLTEEGASFLDPAGVLEWGIPVCAPEGDAATGMVATNSVSAGTGNVSAGTSVFTTLVTDKPLSRVYYEIDCINSPDGSPAYLIHGNNCCTELDSWVGVFKEFASLIGSDVSISDVYRLLYENAMKGEGDCGGIVAYNYLSGEHITGVEKGRPMYFRLPEGKMSLSSFMRAQLYSSVAVMKLGVDLLRKKEGVNVSTVTAHGGLFKVEGVAQNILANALNTSVCVSETAGEGGAWGMALLASYMVENGGASLGNWLNDRVFANAKILKSDPDVKGVADFDRYMELYNGGLEAQKALSEVK